MSVYLFVPSVFGILLPYSTWAVATFGSKVPFCLDGSTVTWRSISHASARRYTLFKVTSIDELDVRTSFCNDSELLESMYPPIIYYWPKHWPSRELCTFTNAEQFSIVCCDTYSFPPPPPPPLKYQSRSCGKWDKHDCKSSSHFNRNLTLNSRLKYVWFSGYPTDNPF